MALALIASACTPREEPIVDRFFAASRIRDKTALQQFSTVIFEPRDQGIVRAFTITNVSPERSTGTVVTKDITLRASVEMFEEPAVERTLVLTVQQADERQSAYGWMVIAVRDITDGAGSRLAPHL